MADSQFISKYVGSDLKFRKITTIYIFFHFLLWCVHWPVKVKKIYLISRFISVSETVIPFQQPYCSLSHKWRFYAQPKWQSCDVRESKRTWWRGRVDENTTGKHQPPCRRYFVFLFLKLSYCFYSPCPDHLWWLLLKWNLGLQKAGLSKDRWTPIRNTHLKFFTAEVRSAKLNLSRNRSVFRRLLTRVFLFCFSSYSVLPTYRGEFHH